ncbi:hypothetical protein HPB48_012566 [Haemaphysalis longicornis]|uniref:Uncharacterized protein n=1 Tax=Haemaphysalis longicornis TaxID=44386 RepID=A0A9J6GC05_HAELO|nr:hypothetical protein HPB48_012566 [Haemaphysalis longicornis]
MGGRFGIKLVSRFLRRARFGWTEELRAEFSGEAAVTSRVLQAPVARTINRQQFFMCPQKRSTPFSPLYRVEERGLLTLVLPQVTDPMIRRKLADFGATGLRASQKTRHVNGTVVRFVEMFKYMKKKTCFAGSRNFQGFWQCFYSTFTGCR